MRPRDRSITTCSSCRRRKIRCDRVRPACTQCQRSNASCVYEDSLPQVPRTYRFIEHEPVSSSLPDSAADSHVIEGDSIPLPIDRIAALEARVERLASLLKSSSTLPAAPDPTVVRADRPSTPLSGEHLSRQGSGRYRYVSPAFWAAICSEVGELDEILDRQNEISARSNSAARDEGGCFSCGCPHTHPRVGDTDSQRAGSASSSFVQVPPTDDIAPAPSRTQYQRPLLLSPTAAFWKQLPTRQKCNELLRWYFQGYHPLVPLVHGPTFRRRYEQMWQNVVDPSTRLSTSMAFAAGVVAVLFAGSVVYSGQEPNTDPQDRNDRVGLSKHLRGMTIRALRLAQFPRAPTLDTFRAYLICESIWMKEEEPLSKMAFVGLALRAATLLGLHRDPSHFPSIGHVEAEERRRAWWHLVHVDLTVAIAAGLPPMIATSSWDVRMLGELREDAIGTDAGSECETGVGNGSRDRDAVDPVSGQSGKSMVSTAGILSVAKLRYTFAQLQLYDRIRSVPTEREVAEIQTVFADLENAFESSLHRVPPPASHDGSLAESEISYENNATLNQWARLLISAFRDQSRCIKGFVLLKASTTGRLSSLHEETMTACISFLRKFALLVVTEKFQQFYWSWPGNHQPLHAIMMLLTDLTRSPTARYAISAREIIDVIFTISAPSGGLVAGSGQSTTLMYRPLDDGGSEVWSYLRRLRAKAWRSADLDPSITWTRQDAIDRCVTFVSGDLSGVGPTVGHSSTSEAVPEVSNDAGTPNTASSLFGTIHDQHEDPTLLPGMIWRDLDLESFLNNDIDEL